MFNGEEQTIDGNNRLAVKGNFGSIVGTRYADQFSVPAPSRSIGKDPNDPFGLRAGLTASLSGSTASLYSTLVNSGAFASFGDILSGDEIGTVMGIFGGEDGLSSAELGLVLGAFARTVDTGGGDDRVSAGLFTTVDLGDGDNQFVDTTDAAELGALLGVFANAGLSANELGDLLGDRCILTVQNGHTRYLDYAAFVEGMPSHAPDVPDVTGDDVFNIIYSSGTTGQPKGIVLTHEVRARYAALFAAQFRITPESVVLHAGSLVFNGAFVTLMPAWLTGCRYILHERFDAEAFLDTVEREQVTHVMLVPSQIVAILGAPNYSARKLQSLQMFCSVGAPWHREHKEKVYGNKASDPGAVDLIVSAGRLRHNA